MNDEKVMDLIVDIYNNMNDEDKAGFTLETAKEMVKDQIEIDFFMVVSHWNTTPSSFMRQFPSSFSRTLRRRIDVHFARYSAQMIVQHSRLLSSAQDGNIQSPKGKSPTEQPKTRRTRL